MSKEALTGACALFPTADVNHAARCRVLYIFYCPKSSNPYDEAFPVEYHP